MALYQGNVMVSNRGGSYLPFDNAPVQNSDKLVLSGGVYANTVNLTEAQTVAGLKTFSTTPRGSTAPSNNNDLVRLTDLSSRIGANGTNMTLNFASGFTGTFRGSMLRVGNINLCILRLDLFSRNSAVAMGGSATVGTVTNTNGRPATWEMVPMFRSGTGKVIGLVQIGNTGVITIYPGNEAIVANDNLYSGNMVYFSTTA